MTKITLTMSQFATIATDFWSTITEKFIIPFAAMILALLSPISMFYHCIIIFITLNFVAGLTDDLKRGQKFSWDKFKVFMLRIIFYILTITMVYLFEKFIIAEIIGSCTRYLTAFSTGLISLYEIRSFLINASRITGNPVFTTIFAKIQSFFNRKTNNDDGKADSNS